MSTNQQIGKEIETALIFIFIRLIIINNHEIVYITIS